MVDDPLELYEFADQEARGFLKAVTSAANKARNERELQTGVDRLLTDFAASAGLAAETREEYTVITGRVDAVHHRLVIEYEPPGSMRPDLRHRGTAHAVQQAKDYIIGVAHREGHQRERLLGLAFDGQVAIFVRYRDGDWHLEGPLQWNEHVAGKMLRAVVGLGSGRALTAENLVEDFGLENPRSTHAIRILYEALGEHKGDLVEALYTQWRVFFAEVSGHEQAGRELKSTRELRSLGKSIGIDKNVDPPRLFFSMHTYFSFIAKTIANLLLQNYAGGSLGVTPLSVLAQRDSSGLRLALEKVENGGIFRALGLLNLLEGDFFSWYIHSWSPSIETHLRSVIARLGEYNPATVEADPTATRDILKQLYQYLMPRKVRHDLGEYYTPDWLATLVYERLGDPLFLVPKVPEDSKPVRLDKRLLDPACGSGTFLILAIQALRAHARNQGLGEADTLSLILRNVVGVDLNPLAVLAARVGYLLAIADLLPFRRGEVTIPVYMADSIVKPTVGETLAEGGRRSLNTVVGRLPVPTELKSARDIQILTDVLYDYIEADFATDVFLQRIERDLGVSSESEAIPVLRDLYEQCISLRRDGRNGVWARVLKNAFMPLFFEQFDYIAGNPPWIGWESLPAGYKQQSAPLWVRYGLFAHSGFETILGKGKKDLSALMTYVVMSDHLKPDGRLGFLITQAMFKGAGAAAGFRRFMLPRDVPIRIHHVDDMSWIQPFEGAATRTTLVVIKKGERTKYPVPYVFWRKTAVGRGIRQTDSMEEVRGMTTRLQFSASPVNTADPTSSWLTARKGALPGIRKTLGESDYSAHEGANSGGANGVFWLRKHEERPDGLLICENVVEGAKRRVPSVTVPLEKEYLFPLLRQGEITRWGASPSILILVVQDPVKKRGIEERILQRRAPHTYSYLKGFEQILRDRALFKRFFTSTVKGILTDRAPFYSMFGIGEYTFEPYKVVWPNMGGKLGAAVVAQLDGSPIVPQHIVTLVGCKTAVEAHFISACVNSAPFQLAAHSYSQSGGKSFGTPHLLENLRIPMFDSQDRTHTALAELSKEAHVHVLGKQSAATPEVEVAVDQAAARLWGLTSAELLETQRSLANFLGTEPPGMTGP